MPPVYSDRVKRGSDDWWFLTDLSLEEQDFLLPTFLTGLEGLIRKLENVKRLGLANLTQPQKLDNSAYDPETARAIRKKAGFSQAKLAEELGLDHNDSAKINISLYELGKQKLGNPPRGELPKRYLGWLKEQGYNPYNL